MAPAKQGIAWPGLDRPQSSGALTVQDVLRGDAGDERDAMVMQWAHLMKGLNAGSWGKE
jgi:hypothetical protein